MSNEKSTTYVYVGHHKCASQWIASIVESVCSTMGMRYSYLFDSKLGGAYLSEVVQRERYHFISYANPRLEDIVVLKNFRGFNVIRDPRDIIISGYFSHRNSHTVRPHYSLYDLHNILQKMDKHDGLFAEMEYDKENLMRMYEWDYAMPEVLELKLEEVSLQPYTSFVRVFRHLGLLDESAFPEHRKMSYAITSGLNKLNKRGYTPLPLRRTTVPAEILLGIVHQNRFSSRAGGRTHGIEDEHSHYRKGVASDWVHHFSDQHIKAFKDHFGDILVRLGYEPDNNWDLENHCYSRPERTMFGQHSSRAAHSHVT